MYATVASLRSDCHSVIRDVMKKNICWREGFFGSFPSLYVDKTQRQVESDVFMWVVKMVHKGTTWHKALYYPDNIKQLL